jgi:hypothetical protein
MSDQAAGERPKKWSGEWFRVQAANTLLGQVKLPGWLFLLLAIVIAVPDWKSRYEFWLEVAKSSGGFLAMVAGILEWPYFSPALGIVGVLYLLLVGQPRKGVQRHPLLPIIGWISFAVCCSAIIVTAGYGAVEIYIRTEIAKGISGIPRGTPGETNTNRPQTPIYADGYDLYPDQIRILIQEFTKLQERIPIIYFAKVLGDNTSNSVQAQMEDIFRRSGIGNVQRISQSPRGLAEEGLMISVHDLNNIPIIAQKVREAI